MKRAIFLSAVTLIVACSPMKPFTSEEIDSKEPSANETKEDKNPMVGHGIVNYHMTNKNTGRSNMYETNQNPNNYRNMSSKRFTISDDQDKIREAVKDSTGKTPQFVSINGNNAWVHVNIPPEYSKEQRKDLHQKIQDAVELAMPRYRLHIRLD